MPFDTTNFDYTKVTPVYDKDNPPKRMSEAIRMAVADVEAQERAGIEYEWANCMVCTAGAVCRRINVSAKDWDLGKLKSPWSPILSALSTLSFPCGGDGVGDAYRAWPNGFHAEPSFEFSPASANEDVELFCADMLALADLLEAEGS